MSRLVGKKTRRKDLNAEEVGGKGLGLVRLTGVERDINWLSNETFFPGGIHVPDFFIVPIDYDYRRNSEAVMKHAERLGSKRYAVRSSSPLEDSPEHSFDGIFRSYLRVKPHDLLDAIGKVKESAHSRKAIKHSQELGIEPDERMAVIVQQMINGYNGVVYSKFPASHDIAKVIGIHKDGYSVDIFLRAMVKDEDGKDVPNLERRLFNGSLYLNDAERFASESPKLGHDEEKTIAELSLEIEREFGYPVRVEYLTPKVRHLGYGANDKLYIVQARPVAGQDKLTAKVEIPELEEGLVFGTAIVNGAGDVTLPAVNITSKRNPHGLSYRTVKRLDAQHPEGYVLVCNFIQFYHESYDDVTPNKRAVVAVSDAGQHHDLDVARAKGMLYLGSNFNSFDRSPYSIPRTIKTGDMIRVVSDGSIGFVYKV